MSGNNQLFNKIRLNAALIDESVSSPTSMDPTGARKKCNREIWKPSERYGSKSLNAAALVIPSCTHQSIMEGFGQYSEGLYDPTKTKLPARYRNKMPSLTHLKNNPCASLWTELVDCYAHNAFDPNMCVTSLLAYQGCSKNLVREVKKVFRSSFCSVWTTPSPVPAALQLGAFVIACSSSMSRLSGCNAS